MRRQTLISSLLVALAIAATSPTVWSQDLSDWSEERARQGELQRAVARDSFPSPKRFQIEGQPLPVRDPISPQLRSLLDQTRGLPPNHPDQEAKQNALREALKVEFDSMQAAREKELAALEDQLRKIREAHQSRSENADKIIGRRLDQLIGRPDRWGWTPPPLPFSIANPVNASVPLGTGSFRPLDPRFSHSPQPTGREIVPQQRRPVESTDLYVPPARSANPAGSASPAPLEQGERPIDNESRDLDLLPSR